MKSDKKLSREFQKPSIEEKLKGTENLNHNDEKIKIGWYKILMDLTVSIEQNKNNVQCDLENKWILIRSHWKKFG